MANRARRNLEAKKRYSVAKGILFEDGRPLPIPSPLIVHCLAAGGYDQAEYQPRLALRVAFHILRLFTFLKGALAERRLSRGAIQGGTHGGR